MRLRFHFDEHIPTALADALRHRGIDVTTTSDAGLLGAKDRDHLAFVTNEGRVLVTQDADFLRLHASGEGHAGIAFCQPQLRGIGEMLRRLILMHAALSAEDMKNKVEYV